MKKFNELITKEIRLKRLETGITQAEIAKRANISPIIYGHIESGRRELKTKEIIDLCNILKLPLEETLNRCNLKSNNTIDEKDDNFKGRVVAFTSFKGGVGVSTLAKLFSNKISEQYNILLIDATDQRSCYNRRKRDLYTFPETKPMYDIRTIDVNKLSNYLDIVKSDFDYIIIDLPMFFYCNDLENLFLRFNYVFAPFYLAKHHQIDEDNYDEYLGCVEGRLDLFIDLRARIKQLNEEISFTLISFENDMSNEFKEWIEKYDIFLLPQSFKKHDELINTDTMTYLSKNEDIAYAPYIQDTQKMIYYLERETKANLFFEEQSSE